MTAICLPIDASAGSPSFVGAQHRAAQDAFALGRTDRPLGAVSGIRAGAEPVVSVTSSDWTVGICNGIADPPGTAATIGAYLFAITASETGSMFPPDGSHQRIDRLDLQFPDDPATGVLHPVVICTEGVASGAPSAPAAPARSIPIGTVLVDVSGGSSPVFTSTWLHSVASGGILPVRNSGEYPAHPYVGQCVYDIALKRQLTWNGSAWGDLTLIWQANDSASFVTVADSTFTDVTLDDIDFDTASVGVAGGKFTVPRDGRFLVSGVVRFPSNTTGARSAQVAVNGTGIAATHTIFQTVSLSHSAFLPTATAVVECSAGDVISLQAWQDSGGGSLVVGAGSSLTVVQV